MKFLARKGEVVTCENGHEICDVVVDIAAGDAVRSSGQFANWRSGMPEPKPSEPLAPCAVCGARWAGKPPGFTGSVLHIGKEWRGSLTDNWAPDP